MSYTPESFAEFRNKTGGFPKCYEGCVAVFCDPRTWLTVRYMYLNTSFTRFHFKSCNFFSPALKDCWKVRKKFE